MPRSTERSTVQVVAAVVVAVGVVLGALWPVPYVVMTPGPVIDVLGTNDGKPLITIKGARTYPTAGQLDLTTVSESGGPHGRVPLSRVFTGWLDTSVAVVPTVLIYPAGETGQQVEEQNTEEMLQSQDSAAIAALRHLGYPVTLTVSVTAVTPGSAADGHLKVGDRIVSVDGKPVSSPDQVVAAVQAHRPGQTVVVGVQRDGKHLSVPLVTKPATGKPGTASVGVSVRSGYTSPVTVSIRLDDVGGPSAGLMFSLGIVDKMTLVQENGGRHVAGTGTIDADGRVGAIGGVRQKMAGARNDGATIFLVPAANCSEALLAVPDGLQLVKVTTLDDALKGMAAAVVGKPTPTCTP